MKVERGAPKGKVRGTSIIVESRLRIGFGYGYVLVRDGVEITPVYYNYRSADAAVKAGEENALYELLGIEKQEGKELVVELRDIGATND